MSVFLFSTDGCSWTILSVFLYDTMLHMKIICLSSIVIKQELLLLSYWPSASVAVSQNLVCCLHRAPEACAAYLGILKQKLVGCLLDLIFGDLSKSSEHLCLHRQLVICTAV